VHRAIALQAARLDLHAEEAVGLLDEQVVPLIIA